MCPDGSHYSGFISMVGVSTHSGGGRDFDLPSTQTLPLLRGYLYGVSTQCVGGEIFGPSQTHLPLPLLRGYPSMVFQHSAEQGTSAPPVSKGFDRVWPGLRHARVDNTRDGFSPITVTSPPPDFRTQWPFPITLSLSDFRIVREPRPEVRAFPLRWVGVRRRDLR